MAVNRPKSTSSLQSASVLASLTNSMEGEAFDVGDTKVQHYGLLMKKPFGHKSARWQKRFFIVKEGFLLYYPESENKAFERAHTFNIHPKGVIPLGGCQVEEAVSGSQKFAIRITHDHFKGEIWVGAENQEDSKEWCQVLRDAGKVTWRNAQFGEKVIIQMEEKSKETAAELKVAIDKLNEKASVLEEEKEKKAELQALAAKLETEKKAVEDAAKSLREEKDTVQQELQQTIMSVNTIEEEKESLFKATEELQTTLEAISKEKEKTTAELQERERLARELEEEKQLLEEATSHLKAGIISMEERQRLLEEEKELTIEQLRSQEETAKKLESEKREISDTAQSLQANLEQVAQEKETTESKWKQERQRRIRTEKRLRLAEDSLKRLDKALKESGVQIDIQIETDVKHLKRFFEDCIAEEQFEAQKLDIMRDALRAKTTYTTTTQNMENMPIKESPEPPSPTVPLSPTDKSPMPVPPETVETTLNGTSRNTSAGVEAVTNGETLKGSEVVADGNEGSKFVTSGDANKSVEGVTNGESCQPESKISEVTNGIPEVV